MRLIVVGGGIVGVATARLAALQRPEAEVLLLERESELAQHQSSHNSGVVHAGLYYQPGSLKARLCRRGAGLMRELCNAKGLPYEECGKVVIATEPGELERLERLGERAAENEVPGLRRLDASELREIEPHAVGLAALHSPETAIADFAAVTRALAEELAQRGGQLRLRADVRDVRSRADAAEVRLSDGSTLTADRVIVCAGAQADRLAAASGEPDEPRIVPFRGEYWKLAPERTGLVKGLIYPVPDPGLPFLGVHLTRKVDGEVWVGPNAVLSLARQGYGRASFDRRDAWDALRWPGTWRMAARHWRAGIDELRRSASKRVFIADARRYVPELRSADVQRAPSGLRAQALDRDGTLVDDFRLSVAGRVCWVRNAPSPAATSSLAIAEELLSRAIA
ncbi:MAG TPA: L-2-hydroxyglutarate oxidase [Solirubrobacteraceae bacterium]|jgi:L-2-hydroxyglutarate oxidase LhgO